MKKGTHSENGGKISAIEDSLSIETMSQTETLAILDDVQTLVSDRLQVVSYKWLSRNFLVSSNAAKRLLEEFVEKHGSGVEVVYALSGWLKSSPPSYSLRLVSGPKLAEAKQEFDGNCSVQVYSVQACIPKDPAAIWNTEFVQAEELFNQPSAFDDCLRDSRFCSIINSYVKHNGDGTPVSNAAVQPKISGIPECSKVNNDQNNTVPPPHPNKDQLSSPKISLLSHGGIKDVKGKTNGAGVHDQATKSSADKEKNHPLPAASKLKGQNDKSSSVSGVSLANLWGRASAKSKPNCALANASADAQICARESIEEGRSDDDDAEDVNFRRASNGEGNRKRKVVMDFSDEDEFEDAVNLASPDLPKGQSCVDLKQSKKDTVIEPNSLFNEVKEGEPKVKEEEAIVKDSNLRKDSSSVSKTANIKTPLTEKNQISASENNVNNKVADAVPSSPKRRKVLKTRIDERGREVTEVVWEGEETETKKADIEMTKKEDSNTTKKVDNNTVTNNITRPAAANKKSPALGSTAPSTGGSKAGNKKSGNSKDPKQGNILSFFKRV